MRVVVISMFAALSGCGRLGFDPAGDDGGTAASDGPQLCASLPCSGRSAILTCGTRCFSVCDEGVSQPAAKARCTAWGGALVSIHSQAEQVCVETLLESAGTWIGYEQGASTELTGNWAWSDGTPVDFAPQWFMAEPNDGDGTENGIEQCGDLFTNGAWNDDDCMMARSFACAR